MMLVWVISRVMLAREELGQDQGQHAEIEMVAMLDVRQFQSLPVNTTQHNINLFISLIFKEREGCNPNTTSLIFLLIQFYFVCCFTIVLIKIEPLPSK